MREMGVFISTLFKELDTNKLIVMPIYSKRNITEQDIASIKSNRSKLMYLSNRPDSCHIGLYDYSNTSNLSRLNISYQNSQKTLRESTALNAKLDKEIEKLNKRIDEVKADNATQYVDHEFTIAEMKADHCHAIAELKSEHLFTIAEMKEDHRQAIAELKADHQFIVAELKAEIVDLRSESNRKDILYNHTIAEMKSAHSMEIANLGIKYDRNYAEMTSKYDSDISELKKFMTSLQITPVVSPNTNTNISESSKLVDSLDSLINK